MRKRLVLALFGVIILIALALGGVEVYVRASSPRTLSYEAIIRQRPPPYQNSPYWSDEFLSERFNLGKYYVMMPDSVLGLADYVGEYYNLAGGERSTVGQPSDYQNAIYLFGGSTIFDPEVPDSFTMASQLQTLVNPKFRVVNRGIPALIDEQIERRIEETTFDSGDIVVFYEPWNNFLSVIQTSIETDKTPLCHLLDSIPFIRQHSVTVATACQWSNILQAGDLQRIEEMRQRILQTVKRAQSFVNGMNAQFFYVTPPMLWAKSHFTNYEHQILGKIDTLPNGLLTFGEQIPSIDLSELSPIDLYHLLDEEDNVFLTQAHVNERGNRIISQAIYDNLFGMIGS